MPARPYYEHEPMSGSPTIIRRVDVVTTTLFTGPTVLAPPINSSSPVPIPAIAGGACAGAVIAVLVVVGWKWWGRSIKRKQRTERQKRADLQAAVAYHRAVTGKPPKRRSSTSRERPHHDRKVTFAHAPRSSSDLSKEKANGPSHPSMPVPRPRVPSAPKPLKATEMAEVAPQRPAHARQGSTPGRSYAPLRPSPLSHGRPPYRPKVHISLPPVPTLPPVAQTSTTMPSLAVPTLTPAASQPSGPELAHKSSTVSSASHYSTQSGEERRARGTFSSMLAQARRLSTLTRSSGSDHSKYSTIEEQPERRNWRVADARAETEKYRISSGSSLIGSLPEVIPGIPIGYAYGGEEEENLQETAEPVPADDLEAGGEY